ncbi:MAG: SOS response-associated peptidase [Pseudomonadota bacterium]|nr:SOS response-associated peptidase [Pseudomonadota bacterium]
MCNRYGYLAPVADLVEEFSQTRVPIRWPEPGSRPNLPPLPEIRPTDSAPLVRAFEGGAQLDSVRWGFPPAPGRKSGPVINFRSEGRRFTSGRCLIPASYFFEFTGERYPKTKWRFTKPGEPVFCIAGLWREGADGPAFTMLTTEPGPDVAPYHDRQVAVLHKAEWADWLDPSIEAGPLLRPLPAGALEVEQA